MASARALTDHDEIRRWAEERDAKPACVKGTGRQRGDTGMIRLDFPGYSGAGSLESISWDEWFRQFDENNLALMVQDTTARGQASNFNKLVSRKGAGARGGGRRAASGSRTRTASTTRSRKKTASTRTAGRGQKRAAGRSRKGSTGGSQKRTASRSRKSASGGTRKRPSTRQSGSRKRARSASLRGSARTR